MRSSDGGTASAVPGTDPVQQIVHDLVFELVADGASNALRAHPALLTEHAKCLGHGVFRAAKRDGEIADTDSGRAVQAEQDLQAVGVR